MTTNLHRPTRIAVVPLHRFPNRVGDGETDNYFDHPNLDDTCMVEITGDGGYVQIYYPNLAAAQEAFEYGVRQCKNLIQNNLRRNLAETVDA